MTNFAECDSTSLHGALLRVVILPWVGVSHRHGEPDSTAFHYTGMYMDILKVMASAMNFTYTLVEPDDMQLGAKNKGKWSIICLSCGRVTLS